MCKVSILQSIVKKPTMYLIPSLEQEVGKGFHKWDTIKTHQVKCSPSPLLISANARHSPVLRDYRMVNSLPVEGHPGNTLDLYADLSVLVNLSFEECSL